ncbi:hypothetical protein C900_02895 [Fulvivirga imtechensis AK7]|uniref:ABM domain-containing protein n=1 Tax=Fulvivirga imtechensis AK7 TaxID=1237149 RepID=L8JR04_9BACT|nr:hypothetical protein [Fulvivirga imtechensis]ELR71280.1 hypothetical protein C900_02895 [Fulvivirga imtechensis AK7]
MGKIVVVAYRAKEGKEQALKEVIKDHIPVLAKEDLITDREPIVMQAADGSVIEVFEWKSAEAIEQAHGNPAVQKLWERFYEVCEFEKPVNIDEFHELFSEFEAIN